MGQSIYEEGTPAADVVAWRDGIVQTVLALGLTDPVLRGIAIARNGEPELELHVDFETDDYSFWVTISQRLGQVIVYRHAKRGYDRQKFRWGMWEQMPLERWVKGIIDL